MQIWIVTLIIVIVLFFWVEILFFIPLQAMCYYYGIQCRVVAG
jgi:hypothetical protein